MDILFIEPVFKERIWGGQKLNTRFGYTLPFNKTGECWAISAHPHGLSKIKNGRFKGQTLFELYENNRELFNHISFPKFPLLTKILDANDDLSVQVHPSDDYALKYENELGKTECWIVLEADEGAKIIYGHHAKTRNELKSMIDHHQLSDLLIEVPVKKGDFFYVPSGTIHALGKGVLILETQQSSDTTYRLYDYDRLDDSGKKRELHLEKSIEVVNVPHQIETVKATTLNIQNSSIIRYISNPYFTVEKWIIHDHLTITSSHFKLVSVIDGSGSLNGEKLFKGDHLILSGEKSELVFLGNMELVVSWV